MKVNLTKFFRPTPAPVPVVQAAASDIVSRANLIEEIKAMPEGAHAVMMIMVPDPEDGYMVRSQHYPSDLTQIAYHGLYNYAAEYFTRRVHGDMTQD